jgi:hypothetical protein
MMNLRIVLLGMLIALPVSADQVYSWVDSDGVRHFSDKPPQGEERLSVKGDISSGQLKRDKFNTMQPYIPPTPTKLSQPINADSEGKEGASSNASSSDTSGGESKGKDGDSDKTSLQSRDQQLDGYSKAARIKEIKDAKAQAIADNKAIQDGTKTKSTSKPKTISQKLKSYNASKN